MQHISTRRRGLALGAALGAAALAAMLTAIPGLPARADDTARRLPPPTVDGSMPPTGLQTAVFAGGCFWGVQGVFEHVKGVQQAVSGYAGGTVSDPDYETVSSGTTGHAEAVRVTYDPAVVSYGKLLQIFFSVALDPTQVDRQGPDHGTQYRSELFTRDADQDRVARAYIAQLTAGHVFSRPIATRIDPAGPFYPAERYHQDYLERNPTSFYIAVNDMPKVRDLQTLFPESWQAAPVMVNRSVSGN